MSRMMVAAVLAAGMLATPLPATAGAATCDSVDCVPGVALGVAAGAPCTPSISFVFGVDGDKNTLICSAQGQWVRTGPLVGEAFVGMPCALPGSNAQIPVSGNFLEIRVPGIPVQCVGPKGASWWVHYDAPA
ncbi:MAG: hypothetical protein ACR2JI_00625 [Mycobacterium sp.]